MAKWIEWTSLQRQEWDAWVAQLPDSVKAMILKHDLSFEKLYRLEGTRQHVFIHSFNENGTLTVNIISWFNQHLPPHRSGLRVFGISPEELVECDLPEGITIESTKAHMEETL
jgi:hypothetical protein